MGFPGQDDGVSFRSGMSLRERLQGILAALICVVLGLAAVTLWATLQWQKTEGELRDHYLRSLLLQEVRAATFHAFKEVPEAIVSRDPGARKAFDALLEKVEANFRRWAELAHNEDERRQVESVRASYDAVVQHAHEIFGLIAGGRLNEASRVLEQQIESEDFEAFERVSAGAVESDRKFLELVQEESSRTRELAQIALGTAAAVAVALVALLGFYFSAGLFRPLRAVENALGAIGRGDLQRRIPDADVLQPASVRAEDELSALVHAFNRTMDELSRTTVSKAYLDSIIHSMVEALVVTAPDGTIRTANPAASALFGVKREEILGRPVAEFIAIGDLDPDELVYNRETTIRARSGVEIPVSLSRSVVRAADGGIQGIACVAQDITARKRAEEQIRAALEEKEVLFKEINHRVKNNLQVISSLLSLHARQLADPEAIRILKESRNRIQAMALVHEMLYRTETPSRIHLGDYLQSLTGHLLESYGAVDAGVRLVSRIAPVSMSLEAAIPCGLIINELVTNSLKHAFPAATGGEITVELTESGTHPPRALLIVRDTGVGLPAHLRIDQARTLGLRLVRTLVEQLDGSLALEEGPGAGIRIEFETLPEA
jgi:PAS domain S-box-containing protein